MVAQDNFDLVEEVQRINRLSRVFIRAVDGLDLRELDEVLEQAVQSRLYREFQQAMRVMEEYSGEGASAILRDHLLENVAYGPHVRVENGALEQLWSLSYAGDYNDIQMGQEAAWALSPKSPSDTAWGRSFWWRFVYLGFAPTRVNKKGETVSSWPKLDETLYSRIIEARMSVWGSKAPYWIFIEFGTSAGEGGGTPYPASTGQQPLYKTRAWFNGGAGQRLVDDFIRAYEDSLAEEIEVWFVGDEIGTPTVDEIEERVLNTTWTVWFQQHGKNIRLEQIGGRFTGGRQEALLGTYTP